MQGGDPLEGKTKSHVELLDSVVQEILRHPGIMLELRLARFWQVVGFPQDIFESRSVMQQVVGLAKRRGHLPPNSVVNNQTVVFSVSELLNMEADEFGLVFSFNMLDELSQRRLFSCYRLLAEKDEKIIFLEDEQARIARDLEQTKMQLEASKQQVKLVLDEINENEVRKEVMIDLFVELSGINHKRRQAGQEPLDPKVGLALVWGYFDVRKIDLEDEKAGRVGRSRHRGVLRIPNLRRIGQELLSGKDPRYKKTDFQKKSDRWQRNSQTAAESVAIVLEEWEVLQMFFGASKKDIDRFNDMPLYEKERLFERYSKMFRLGC